MVPRCRKTPGSDDDQAVSTTAVPEPDLLELYDIGLAQVYGYLLARCGDRAVAEDLTSETFMAGVDAVHRGSAALSVGWLMTVARNKLVDHWRRREREERSLRLAHEERDDVVEPWDTHIDSVHAHTVLAGLAPQHRAALTLRYLDGLPVVQVADALGRTLHATETLLVRSKRAFRQAYEHGSPS